MKHYKLSKLIPGYKIRPSLKGHKLVALPWEIKEPTLIHIDGEAILYNKEDKLLHKQEFQDKFDRGTTYTLHYYKLKTEDESVDESQLNLF